MFARRVALATLVQGFGKALALAFSLVSVKLLTGYLGPDLYGSYGIVLAGAGLAFVLADLGVPMLLARELARHPDRADALGANLLFVRLAGCALVLAVTAAITPWLPYSTAEKEGLLIGTAGFLLGTVSLYPMAFFQVNLRLDLAAVVEVVGRAVALGALVVVVVLDLGFLPAVSTIAVSWGAALVLSFALSRRFWRIRVRADLAATRPLMLSALPIAAIGLLGVLHFKLDAVLLSVLKPSVDVGVYTLAYSIFEQSLVPQALFLASVFPILTRFVHASDTHGARDVVDKSLRFLTLLGLLGATLLFTLAEPIVRVMSSDEFDAAATVLRILAFGLVPLYAAAIFSNLLISLASLRAVAIASVAGIALNVTLNLVLIPRWTYDAAAATTVVSETLGLLMIYGIAHRRAVARVSGGLAVRLGLLTLATLGIDLATLLVPWWIAAPVGFVAVVAGAAAIRAVSLDEIRLVVRRPT